MIHKLYQLIFRHWRVRRFQQFLDAMRPGKQSALIDVGGYWWNWEGKSGHFGSILCVNPVEASQGIPATLANLRQVTGDGCALTFADRSFEIAYSNSVIEHVGSHAKQAEFAREVRRVGRKIWVQTPALECPIEPHLLAFGVHWIPGRFGYFLRKYASPRAWMDGPNSESVRDILDNTRLLSRREFVELFPDCRIVTERLLWIFPKSYIAIRDEAG